VGRQATADPHGECAPLPWSLRAAAAAVLVALALSPAANALLRLALRLDLGPIAGVLVQIACLLAAVALASRARPGRAQLLSFGRARAGSGFLLFAGFVATQVASMVWALLVPPAAAAGDDELTDLASAGWLAGLWVVVALVFVGPVAEELLFRRVLLSALRAWAERVVGARGGLVAAAVASSALFALAHVPGGASWLATPLLFANALVFCGLYAGSGSLWPPILLHALVVLQENVSAAALAALGIGALLACAVFLARRGAPRLRSPLRRGRRAAQAAPGSAARRPTVAEEG
jgi:uncharacterized protein